MIRLGQINLKQKPREPELLLCRPNKLIISRMNEAYDIVYNVKLGALNELTFKIPQFIEKKHKMVRNNNADIIRGRYVVQLELGDITEYFLIYKLNRNGTKDTYVEVSAYSLGYQINDKIIRGYTVQSKTATELLRDILENTGWSIGYVDSEFDLKYRGLEVSSATALEVLFDIAETFNAVVVWNTILKTVGFYKPDSIGENKGFSISYEKYLESFNQEDSSEEIITRLKLYGKEDLTIREVNPLGTTYIENFSYFIYPFKRDENRNVLESSEFLSDELCHALLDYEILLENNKDKFSTLREKKSVIDDELAIKNSEKSTLDTEYKILLDDRDVLNTTIARTEDELSHADNVGEEIADIILNLEKYRAQLEVKNVEVATKKHEITLKENEIIVVTDKVKQVQDEIDALKNLLAIENNFTKKQIEERTEFVIEKEWQDSNISEAEDLLKEGESVFEELRKQKITLSLGLVNFLSMISEQRNWDKLGLGDIFSIIHDRLQLSYEAKITEIVYDFSNKTINIEITNIKDLYANKDKFIEMLYKSYSSSTQVSIDKWKWDLSLENKGDINDIINNIWDANKQAILGAKDQVIEISDRGLLIRDPKDPMTYLVGINAMIAITNDGGATFKHAITSTGIVGERIYGKIIMGVNLAIEDEHGVLKFQGSKGEIYDRNGKLVMKLGLVEEEPDAFGMSAFNDITKVSVTDKEGFAIKRANNEFPDGWEKILWADQSDGTVYGYDLVVQNIKIVNDIGKEILNAETDYFDIGSFETIVADNKLTTLEKLQIITELNQLYSGYRLLVSQGEEYIRSRRDDVLDVDSQFFESTPSIVDRYSLTPLKQAYTDLINYMSQYIAVTTVEPLNIDVNNPITEKTSEIADRAEFILKFKNYYDEAQKLRDEIQDSLYYSSINMGGYYNNLTMGNYGFIALRDDGKYRAFLNATNGLALQKWEKDSTGVERWVSKVYGSIGSPVYEDGTLIAEDLVAKRLIIENKNGQVILNSDTLEMDFTGLDRIVLDNVIMPTEKVTILNQYKTITKQYFKLLEEVNHNLNDVYVDRDSSYSELDIAKSELDLAKTVFMTAYASLTKYLNPIWVDMNAKTHVIDDLASTREEFYSKFEDFSESFEACRNSLNNFLEKSSLQLGRNYNRTVIDAENGIVVTRADELVKTTLNATDGIKIEAFKNNAWIKRFYADTDGNLYAKGLTIESDDGKLILSADSLVLDFTSLESIMMDNVIMPPEKITLKTQLNNLAKQYVSISEQLNQAVKFVYPNRDSYYTELDSAKDKVALAKTGLDTKFNELNNYLAPLWVDMNAKTHIIDDLKSTRELFYEKFESFYTAYEEARISIDNFLEKSSLQLGRNYNKTVIDAVNGITVTRNDEKVRTIMNATEGIMIERHKTVWEKVFYVNTNGILYAKGLVIESDNGKKIVDGTSLTLDFTVLENIMMDNVIMPPEKITLRTQWGNIQKSYNQLKTQVDTYTNTTYSYPALDTARGNLVTARTNLVSAYTALNVYLNPIFSDMNAKTHIVDDLESTRTIFHEKFDTFYFYFEDCRNRLEQYLEKSSLQLGADYNNTMIDAVNGITVTRGDNLIRTVMNATEGIKIERYKDTAWVKQFYADTKGQLYARGLVIEDEDGNQIFNGETLVLDFNYLEKMIIDDLIMPTEKVTILNQFKSMTQQQESLIKEVDLNLTTVYSNRESSYSLLDIARDELDLAKTNLISAYNNMKNYLTPVFADMNTKTSIVDDLKSSRELFYEKFEMFHQRYEETRMKLGSFIEKSTLQLGRNYNKTVIDATNGIVVTRSDGKIKTTLNATDGIKIEANNNSTWVKRLYANTSGVLYAKGLVIESDSGETILDAGALTFDFTKLGSIIMDNVIMPPEKITLRTDFNNLSKQYVNVVAQIDKCVNDIYVKRERFYDGLDAAKDTLVLDKTNITNAFNALKNYLAPIFVNMNGKTHIINDLKSTRELFYEKFETFYNLYEAIRNDIEKFLEQSSLQLGRNYNNTVIDAENGITVTRQDGKIRTVMNATTGISIETYENTSWIKKFYADTNGKLYAKGLTIEGDDGAVLLDAEKLTLDFTALDKILMDNVIMPTEKISLRTQWGNIQKQYTKLLELADNYGSTTYSYSELNTARNNLNTAKTNLTNAYTALQTYLTPVFTNMNAKTHIVNDLSSTRTTFYSRFDSFYTNYDDCRNKLNVFLEKSSIQLGKNYNRTVIDAQNGITVTGLRGESVRMNANEGFAIDVNGEKRMWIDTDGTIRAKKLIIEPAGGASDLILDEETDGYISDLIVNSVKSISKKSGDQYYFSIRNSNLKLMYGSSKSTDVEKMGIYPYNDNVRIRMGTPDANGRGCGYLIKDDYGMRVIFSKTGGSDATVQLDNNITVNATDGNLTFKNDSASITMNSSSITIKFGSSSIQLSSSGIKVLGNRIDLN